MRCLPLLLLPLLAACATSADEAPAVAARAAEPSAAELIAARKAMMRMAATLLYEGVMPAVKNGTDVKRQQQAANGLARFGHSISGLFPPGSTDPDSKALPAVWENKADFEARAHAFGAAADRLAELAGAGDSAGFAAQAKIVDQGCDSCHDPYRAKRGTH